MWGCGKPEFSKGLREFIPVFLDRWPKEKAFSLESASRTKQKDGSLRGKKQKNPNKKIMESVSVATLSQNAGCGRRGQLI